MLQCYIHAANSEVVPKYVLYIPNQKASSLRNTNLLKFRTKTVLEMIAKIIKSRISIIEKLYVGGWMAFNKWEGLFGSSPTHILIMDVATIRFPVIV